MTPGTAAVTLVVGMLVSGHLLAGEGSGAAEPNDTVDDESSWTVEALPRSSSVRYTTNGHAVHGHQFGFLKQAGSCGADVVWLTWSSPHDGLIDYKGQTAEVRLTVADTTRLLRIPIVAVSSINKILHVAVMTNLAADHRLKLLLASSDEASVTVVAPKELVGHVDVSSERFDITGFATAHEQATEACQSL
ncbi:hypothetical protein [Spectribacter hydrogenoxidans]|uniref:Uncharacterized protein n=1 Tax=Spectribacter hydrogenoxidans TaxID=3075608 RepID=A0ABU3C454_9GAMM|nr:hypothetical protein [Salinisphaera sp. W335]MDT0636348.1 hypothetical protein [Salinisphaera sp. W335]